MGTVMDAGSTPAGLATKTGPGRPDCLRGAGWMLGLAVSAWMSAAVSFHARAEDIGIDFFERNVRPILAEHCLGCHGSGPAAPKGGLRLDTKAGWQAGGGHGPAVVPGKPSESLVFKAVRREPGVEAMPPAGEGRRPLTLQEVGAIESWIAMGAPDPREGAAVVRKADPSGHWAFQRPVDPPRPEVRDASWPRRELDFHVLAGLERKDLRPAPEAEGRTWLRRATYDLTGMPPSMEEVGAFLGDREPGAYERAVDRLLASPRFGERWGRWWLDVARYADSKGYVFEEERRYAYSHTYRDWVVRAFNRDLPYDRFLVEQMAGDRLATTEDPWPKAALGFLTLGRRFLNNPNDIIDDRIDVVFRGTQALTVGCARCHDHKSDPIPTADYYSLYGVFASSEEPAEKPLLGANPNPHQAALYEAERAKRQKELSDYRAEQTQVVLRKLRERIGDQLLCAEEARSMDGAATEALARTRSLDPGLISTWKDYLGKSRGETNAVLGPWHALASLGGHDFASRAAGMVDAWSKARDGKVNPWVLEALREAAPTNMAAAAAAFSKAFGLADKAWASAKEASAKAGQPDPPGLDDPAAEALRVILHGPDSPIVTSTRDINRYFETSVAQRSRALVRKLEELDATHPGAPLRAMALVDKASPSEPVVFKRGNPGNHGPRVPRQFLSVLSGPGSRPFTDGSGRLEMARRIASADNPLTARVFVNRVWGQLIGIPLVASVSDFGVRTEPPVHPALMDHLASRFMAQGWGIKDLMRDIVLSATYRQASDPGPDPDAIAAFRRNVSADPANAWHGRMNRKRMDFEGLRDSLLGASGTLDMSIGGQPVEMFESVRSSRRTLYGFIDRQNLPAVLRSFDFANPDATVARRFQTTVPQQALFMLNNGFVAEAARAAARASAGARDGGGPLDVARVRWLYRACFQREPDAEEIRTALMFVAAQGKAVPEPRPAATWTHGTGRWNDTALRLEAFAAFPIFKDKEARWQASKEFPGEGQIGFAYLGASRGHPGRSKEVSVVRRWTAPSALEVEVSGELSHASKSGDGVEAIVVSGSRGILGRWRVHHGKVSTTTPPFSVQRGEVIDFVVVPVGTDDSDTFDWAPALRSAASQGGPWAGMGIRSWEAQRDFRGPATDPAPLDAWGRYAQVLLSSNEFVFID